MVVVVGQGKEATWERRSRLVTVAHGCLKFGPRPVADTDFGYSLDLTNHQGKQW